MPCPVCGSDEFGYDIRSHSMVCMNCGYIKQLQGTPPNIWMFPISSDKKAMIFLAGEIVIFSTFILYFNDSILFLLFSVIWYLIVKEVIK